MPYPAGRPLSPEHRAAVSAFQRGRPKSPAHRAAISAAMQRPEVRDKLSVAHLGRKHSPEENAAQSARQIGVPRSPQAVAAVTASLQRPEVRAAKRAALIGRPRPASHRAAMSAGWTPEARAAQSAIQGQTWTVERRETASATAQAHWDRVGRAPSDRRKRMLNSLQVEHQVSSDCGVCHKPLDPSARWPDPMSTEKGHEPPLSRLAELAQNWVIERPEHRRCNNLKGARLDSEMEGAPCPI